MLAIDEVPVLSQKSSASKKQAKSLQVEVTVVAQASSATASTLAVSEVPAVPAEVLTSADKVRMFNSNLSWTEN